MPVKPVRSTNDTPDTSPALATVVAPLLAALLEPILERVLARVLTEHAAATETSRRSLLTIDDLVAELGVSRSKIYELRNAGLPCIMIGDSPRFEREVVIAWLRDRR